MTADGLHRMLVGSVLVMAAITATSLLFVTAPYGRHLRPGWGPTLPNRLGWFLMETPAALGFAAIYAAGEWRTALTPLVLLGLWESHYLHRAFVYPLQLRGSEKRMPVLVMALGISFNVVNAWINARWVSSLGTYPDAWLADPRFLLGAALFIAGRAAALHSDSVLRNLRRPGESGYRIPAGGLYRWVSCPNYLGEIVEWTGWALATWSWAGLAFAVYTVANLAPRALSHHRWYHATFPDYPRERRALIPHLF